MQKIREAKALLSAAGITDGRDFDSLTEAQATAIRCEAAVAYERKHGAPMPADSASYIRKRYDLLQQRAQS